MLKLRHLWGASGPEVGFGHVGLALSREPRALMLGKALHLDLLGQKPDRWEKTSWDGTKTQTLKDRQKKAAHKRKSRRND